MAKTPHRQAAPKQQANTAKRISTNNGQLDFFRNVALQSWLIFAFAFLLYANTLKHGFVYDDGIVITENMYTQQGVKGIGGILSHDTFFGFFKKEGNETLVTGGRYRPMSLVLFAFLYQIVGAAPFLFHFFTVLLFALTCVVLYRTLLKLLSSGNSPPQRFDGYLVAWFASVLFAAHPIHTEAVANIKGCDEILALLASLLAMFFTLKAWDQDATSASSRSAIFAGVSFFIACLSKENAVAFALLIPLALWFFRPLDGAVRRSIFGASKPVLIGLSAFILIRGSILSWLSVFGGNEPMELMNNPFLKFDGSHWVKFAATEKFATIFYTLWEYLQLLVVPHPLTHDYYPRHIDIMGFGHPKVLLSLAVYGFMGFWALRGIKGRDPFAFAILLYLLPLGIVSNLVFPVGTNMSERFVFMPSIGFCFLLGLLLMKYLEKNRSLVLGFFAVTVILFSAKTMLRNAIWESNERLFKSDVEVSANSVKLQNACGQLELDSAKKEKNIEKQRALCLSAITRFNKALEFYPNFKIAFINRAGAYALLQQYPEAISDYRKALELVPDDPKRKTMLALTLREAGKYNGQQKNDLAGAFKCLNESWQLNPKDPETARLFGVANFVQGKQAEAIEWYSKAEAVAPKDAGSLWELGLAYANLGLQEKAKELHQRAMIIDPDIAQKVATGAAVNQ